MNKVRLSASVDADLVAAAEAAVAGGRLGAPRHRAGHRELVALVKRELQYGRAPVTHGGVVGQVWRGGGGRQARLARFLPALEVVPIDGALDRRAGVLRGQARTSDVIDAALVLLARDGDSVLTSDVGDVARLAAVAGLDVDVLRA